MAREIEAADCGLLSADPAAGIGRVKNGNGSLDLYILNENPWPQG